MAVRLYVAFAVLVSVAVLWLAADHAGYARLPWKMESGLQSALVRPASTLDLETGAQRTPAADLHWGMAARDQPYLRAAEGALIAEGGSARWEEMDAAYVARLRYAPNQYSAWGEDAPVRRGALFGVRTAEGNFARVRIADIGDDYALRLEWTLYPGAGKTAPAKSAPDKAPPNASVAWHAPRDEALAAYKAQRFQEALDACGRAVAEAEKAGPAVQALALTTCGGLQGLHARASAQMEDWLKQAVAILSGLEQEKIVAALGPQEALLKERALRMLGVFYRDQNRPREAAESFALAVDTVRALPPPETALRGLALRADLHDLGLVLAQYGFPGTARRALGEARELYLATEPDHPALKAIDAELRRLEVAKP